MRGDDGSFACRVAYGTKHLRVIHRMSKDVIIQNSDDIAVMGLYRATRFDLDEMIDLPWSSEFFGCWTGYSTPILGALTEHYIRDYAYLMMKRLSASPPD
jgi:hypothetical protein